jgi:uncharacterized membrane protein HdeD (DUF308 family)
MRALFGLLALFGLAGIVAGVLTMMRGSEHAPFSYENYGGPGPIIAGVILLAVGLYLLSTWPRSQSRGRAAHNL